MSNIVDQFTGGANAAHASRAAADEQVKAGNQAINYQNQSAQTARADLQPYATAGNNAVNGLSDLITNPNAQKSYVQDNPFFKALSDQASQTLFNNSAAKGKVGSGGTAEALQNSLLLLGNDLVSNNIAQRQGLASLGLNAASGQANITQNNGNAVSDIYTGQGNARAAGLVGGANAIQAGRSSLINALGGAAGAVSGAAVPAIAACDIRLKTDIQPLGINILKNNLPLYLFKYKNDNQFNINVMAQDVEKVMPDAVIEIKGYKHIKNNRVWQ